MAAGASAPELFSNFVSIFITHSALGMGTIVGSEIFNQLVICAGAIFAGEYKYLVGTYTLLSDKWYQHYLTLLLSLFTLDLTYHLQQ